MQVRSFAAATAFLGVVISSGTTVLGAPTPSPTDTMFATQAIQGGIAEVADAQLALRKSKDPMVLTFARRMVVDQRASNARLRGILRRLGIDAATDVGPANMLTQGKLNILEGEAFDSAYLKAQRSGHEQTFSLMRQEIASGQDSALVAFARAQMPTVKEHLAMLNRRSSM